MTSGVTAVAWGEAGVTEGGEAGVPGRRERGKGGAMVAAATAGSGSSSSTLPALADRKERSGDERSGGQTEQRRPRAGATSAGGRKRCRGAEAREGERRPQMAGAARVRERARHGRDETTAR